MINSNSAKYHKSVTNTFDSEPESTDTGTQDGKDAEEKETKMYKNFYKYLTKGCYPQCASKADIIGYLCRGFKTIVLEHSAWWYIIY